MEAVNFLLAGVGGQGTLLASDIVAEVGLRQDGMEAKKSEVHGMSQRGGAVTSHVRWGERIASPLCEKGMVDFFVAQEMLEAMRWMEYLRPGGTIVLSRQQLPPTSTVFGKVRYPAEEQVLAIARERAGKILLVEAVSVAKELGNIRTANTVLLGALSDELDVSDESWLEVVLERVPARHKEINRKAFLVGRERNWDWVTG